MKIYLLLCLVSTMHLENIFAYTTVDYTPSLSPDVVAPVTTNSVYLTKPFCKFDTPANAPCVASNPCSVWVVPALISGTDTFDSDKTLQNFVSSSSYPSAFNSGSNSKNYFLTKLGPLNDFTCPPASANTTPSYFQVGADGACVSPNCNGMLPAGSNMRFKYLLVDSSNSLVAETKWSDNVTLKTFKSPDGLGSGYAGRSAGMVVITSILAAAAALLLLLLLIALILACCCRREKPQSYETRRQPSVIGSLRIPSYDVHHLKNQSPYDNPAYEEELKKRYTRISTLPQKTTTVITTVQNNSPETITVERM